MSSSMLTCSRSSVTTSLWRTSASDPKAHSRRFPEAMPRTAIRAIRIAGGQRALGGIRPRSHPVLLRGFPRDVRRKRRHAQNCPRTARQSAPDPPALPQPASARHPGSSDCGFRAPSNCSPRHFVLNQIIQGTRTKVTVPADFLLRERIRDQFPLANEMQELAPNDFDS